MTTTGTDNTDIKTEPLFPHTEMVKVCTVQLNKISRFLSDLPDEAIADLLICPHSTANIFDRDLGTFDQDAESIRQINENHGIQYGDKTLQGMKIYDRPDNAKKVTYEQAWADNVRGAWEEATSSGKETATELAIGTRPMLCGKDEHGRKVADNNLQAHLSQVNKAILGQHGQEIQTGKNKPKDQKHCSHDWNFTSTEVPGRLHRKQIYSVYMADEWHYWDKKSQGRATSHPMALNIIPSTS